MGESYLDNPHNFDQIETYVITEKGQVSREILMAGKCFFYDACSFRKHLHMRYPEYLFAFFKRQNGVVIVTRGILMELASHSGYLNPEYIAYIEKMYRAELKVLVMYEEDLFELLSMCFTTNEEINIFLSLAVKNVKRPTGTIESTLKTDKALFVDVLKNTAKDSRLYERFFQKVRRNKEADDNLGEELLAVIIHLLSYVPEKQSFKYIVLTEDKGAVGLLGKVQKNVFLHRKVYTFSVMTTSRLAQRLFEEKFVVRKEQVEEILSAGTGNFMIKILGSEKYDLEPKEKTMACGELAEKIVTPNAIHINY